MKQWSVALFLKTYYSNMVHCMSMQYIAYTEMI